MKIYIKIFISLTILFILCVIYTTIKTLNQPSIKIENYDNFYTKFDKLEKKLNSLKQIEFEFPCQVYYINLDSDKHKNKFIQDQIDYYKSRNFIRISGVDARKTNPTHLNGYPINSTLTLSNPELGCLLSHLKAIITAYYSNNDYAIILEDDAYFKHARLWKNNIQDIINNAPSDWNILNLYNSSICCGNLFEKNIYIKHSSNNKCYLTSSYIINRQGMYNILKSIKFEEGVIQLFTNNVNDYHGADELIYLWAGNTYFVKPTTFFVYNDSHKMKTSIQSDNDLNNQITNALYVLDQYI